jgi:hypothetical protein
MSLRKSAHMLAIGVIVSMLAIVGATRGGIPGTAVADSVASGIRGGTCASMGTISCPAGNACRGSYICAGSESCTPRGDGYCGGTDSCALCWAGLYGTCNN